MLVCDEEIPPQHSLSRHSMDLGNLSKSKETLNESNKFIKSNKGIPPQTASDLIMT